MKTTVSALLCAVFCLLASCEKLKPISEETSVQVPQVATMGTVRASLTSGNWLDYQTKWVQLSPEQKYEVWMEKLAETKELPQWSAAQRSYLGAKANSLSPSFFASISSDDEDLADYNEVIDKFSDTEVARIFMDVYPFDHVVDLGPIRKACVCRWSIWCGVMSTCDYGGCDEVSGCGMWGRSMCKGMCDTPNGM